jgi:hypothetical protein
MNPDFSKLDYNDIKQNLIAFLKTQDKFGDYNFEGSTLNILLDILAYNTHYQALYNNLTFNEAFLDTAQKRSSVISIAKNLGYIPASATAASCVVELIKDANDNGELDDSLNPYVLPKNTLFKANKGTLSYNFFNLNTDVAFSPATYNDAGTPLTYSTGPVTIREGSLKTVNFVISGANPFRKLILRSENIDVSTITVNVQQSSSDITGSAEIWTEASNIAEITGESNVYFLEEGPTGFYQIYFGDGILGKKLNEGNLVTVNYLETTGEEANSIGINDTSGSRVFTSPSLPSSNLTIRVVTPSFGGAGKETIESIKYKAPKTFSAQDRAVTANDYSIVLQRLFPYIKSIKCWGGEDNDPPMYGKVFIAIKPENRAALTQTEKNTIIKTLSRNKSVVGIVPELVEPNIIYLIVNIDAKVDIVKAKGSIVQLRNKIISGVNDYIINNLDVFDADLIANELERYIMDSDNSILSLTVTAQLEYRLKPQFGLSQEYNINLQNEILQSNSLDKPNVSSTLFEYRDFTNNIKSCRLYDNGYGGIYIAFENSGKEYSIGKFKNIDLTLEEPELIGSVDYLTGKIVLNKFKPISGTNDIIRIFANLADSDVFVNPNTILSIDVNDPSAVVINFIESAFRKPIK